MAGLFLWLPVGLAVAMLVRTLLPAQATDRFGHTALAGMAGGTIAGYLGEAAGLYERGQPEGILISVLGAFLLLSLSGHVHATTPRQREEHRW